MHEFLNYFEPYKMLHLICDQHCYLFEVSIVCARFDVFAYNDFPFKLGVTGVTKNENPHYTCDFTVTPTVTPVLHPRLRCNSN